MVLGYEHNVWFNRTVKWDTRPDTFRWFGRDFMFRGFFLLA